MAEQTRYEILGVDRSAEPEVIKAAYQRKALLYHPDTNTSQEANTHMQAINEAYEILSDRAKRQAYDAELADKEHEQRATEEAEIRRKFQEESRRAQQTSQSRPSGLVGSSEIVTNTSNPSSLGGSVHDMTARMGILGELLQFLWHRKLYWLIPMIILLAVFIVLIILSSNPATAPFIYPLF